MKRVSHVNSRMFYPFTRHFNWGKMNVILILLLVLILFLVFLA